MKIRFELTDEAKLDAYYYLKLEKIDSGLSGAESAFEGWTFNEFVNIFAQAAFEQVLKERIEIYEKSLSIDHTKFLDLPFSERSFLHV